MRFILLLTITLLAACQIPSTSSDIVVNTLDVKILNGDNTSTLTVEGPEYSKEFLVIDGSVNDTFRIEKSGVYSFIYQKGKFKTYLEPGQTVNLSVEAKGLNFIATFGEEHESAWLYFKSKQDIVNDDLSPRRLYSLEPDDFMASLQTGSDKINKLFSEISLPSPLVAVEKEGIEWHKKHELYVYPLATNQDVSELPVAFKDPLEGVDFQNETKYLENPSYAKIVNTHFSVEMNKDTGEYVDVFMRKIADHPAGNIRNDLLMGTMRYLIGPNERLEECFSFFNKYSTNKLDIAAMKELYQSFQKLLKGNVSPSFDYENYNGGHSKLSDFKGKYVYIDVWATWCGPCKAEIPSLKKKEAKYHDSNIEFVSISIDDKNAYESWKNMVKDKNLGGTQLIADKAWKSDFVQNYKISGIPRFILIDPEGNIVSADAPRPSSNELDEVLNTLKL